MPETVYVSWYTCNCDWLTKYCDDHHQAGAFIPRTILEQYRKTEENEL